MQSKNDDELQSVVGGASVFPKACTYDDCVYFLKGCPNNLIYIDSFGKRCNAGEFTPRVPEDFNCGEN